MSVADVRRSGMRPQAGHVRIAAAVGLMAGVGVLAFGAFRPAAAAQPASWSPDGTASGQGHDLTPVVVLSGGDVMAIGGFNGGTPTTDIEILGRSTQKWSPASGGDVLPAPYGDSCSQTVTVCSLIGAQATLLQSGDVLLTGGRDQQGNATATAAVWDHGRGGHGTGGSNWTVLQMHQARAEHVAIVTAGGRVVVVGGSCAAGEISDTDVFTESGSSGAFQQATNCSLAGSSHGFREQAAGVATSAGDVILTGGLATQPPGGSSCPLAATDEVDVLPAGALTWKSAAALSTAGLPPNPTPAPESNCSAPPSGARLRHTASEVESGGNVFVVVAGGADEETFASGDEQLGTGQNGDQSSFAMATTEVYSAPLSTPDGGSWKSGPPLSSPRADLASAPLTGSQVLISGGRGQRPGGGETDPATGAPGLGLSDALLYNASARSVAPTATMLTGRFGFSLVPIGQGQLLAAGGFSGQSASAFFAQTAEVYTPAVAASSTTSSSSSSSTSAGPTPRPTFNAGQHHLALGLPVVEPGQPLTVRASGLTPGQQVLLVLQPSSVNSLQACGIGTITKVTVPASGNIAATIVVLAGQASPQLAVTLCVIAPPPGGPATAAVPQAVGRAPVIVQARGPQPPFIALPTSG